MLSPDSSPEVTPAYVTSARALEIAHVLFMDIVAYSQRQMDEQTRLLEQLQHVVRNTPEFVRAQKRRQLLSLPIGDGMALVFFGDAESPARCALEISRALRDEPGLRLRMGIHTGPVHRVADINANKNVAGGGINLAQRIMDCGDAGHILTSKSVADVLGQMGNWKPMLHSLGEVKVKHGVRVHIFNLYASEAGNPQLPQKLRSARTKKAISWSVVFAIPVTALMLLAGVLRYVHQQRKLTDKDTILLIDFDNKTGDPIFDDTLKTALTVSLNQSPFLNVLSENKVEATLKLMTRPSDTKLTSEVARELCQRAGSKAYIAGSIATLGSQYVVGLKAVNCGSGDTLVQEQVTASAKEEVLDSLGAAASKLRGELGESMETVKRLDVPLALATTASLDALKAYSLGLKAYQESGNSAAQRYDQRAVELDPNFAMGHWALAGDYFTLGETGRASEYYAKAFQLREHASEREKLDITMDYYENVTGELDKAAQTYQEALASYPRNGSAHYGLGNVYTEQGNWNRAAEEYRESSRLTPDWPSGLPSALLALQRFEEAQQMIHREQERTPDLLDFRSNLYALAFIRGDAPAMLEQQQWFTGHPDFQSVGLSLASDTEAYLGHLGKAQELTKRSVDSAIHADSKENGAIYKENASLREAAFGNAAEAKQGAAEALKLASSSQGVEDEAALAFAIAGDTARADFLVQDLNKRFPLDTQVQSLWLPAIRAQLALNRKNPSDAIRDLQASAGLIELGHIPFLTNISCLYPTYIRGGAFLAAGQGKEAAAEFQKILDDSGIVWNCWTGALAHLGLARAYAMEAKTLRGADADSARNRALGAYKDFLTLWKDADPDIPVLKEAKAEYTKLQ